MKTNASSPAGLHKGSFPSALLLAVLAITELATLATPTWAQWIVYDNSSTPLGQFKPSCGSDYWPDGGRPLVEPGRYYSCYQEFGDRIQMSLPSGTYPLTDFYFEYFAERLAAGGGQQAILRLYANDGPVTAVSGSQRTPGTLWFESSWLGQFVDLSPGWNTVELHGNGYTLMVPDSFTWTVQFTGLQPGDVVGLPLYGQWDGTVDVGSSGPDYWAKQDGEWTSYVLWSGLPANFAARVVAIPEPGAVRLALLAGAGWLGLLAFRRRSEAR